ncbi:MAG: type II toxin-antitoxin system HicA family toxin [Gammaproteobacteria bacterium]|nr:type II toxin-antitoxin system HicA family toxin [Gammaproteobacteria bacterium]MDD9851248.1 type II toxin-antitoxin system HicA family toxin [Gammaproteobacteria bacterium]MDD9870087.1 type II toxin-antitoxin system HicA family toxin [Gammaproteobacteria bacterium]
MNTKQRKTLKAVFKTPTPKNIAWKDLESLLLAVDARKTEGSGSRVRFYSEKTFVIFHKPHKQKEAEPGQVKDARHFLTKLGVTP